MDMYIVHVCGHNLFDNLFKERHNYFNLNVFIEFDTVEFKCKQNVSQNVYKFIYDYVFYYSLNC